MVKARRARLPRPPLRNGGSRQIGDRRAGVNSPRRHLHSSLPVKRGGVCKLILSSSSAASLLALGSGLLISRFEEVPRAFRDLGVIRPLLERIDREDCRAPTVHFLAADFTGCGIPFPYWQAMVFGPVNRTAMGTGKIRSLFRYPEF
jgi:hypothetical protein